MPPPLERDVVFSCSQGPDTTSWCLPMIPHLDASSSPGVARHCEWIYRK